MASTTACKWDVIIPFEPLWKQYERIIKDSGAIVLFGSEPFSSHLRISNLKMFRYDWIWDKVGTSSGVLAKKRPLKKHEIISIFYKKLPTYNPQMETGTQWHRGGQKTKSKFMGNDKVYAKAQNDISALKYPKSIIIFSNADRNNRIHETEKPILILEYLIKTYTNEGETVLDNCMGSGSTGVAALKTKRLFIGIEKDEHYFNVAKNRIEAT